MSPLVWAGVLVIGGCGAVLRFLVDGAVSARLGPLVPLRHADRQPVRRGRARPADRARPRPDAALLAGTAAVGSYTTFSTWMFETQRLGEDRQVRPLSANLVVSLVAGVAAAALGRWIGAARPCSDRGRPQAHHLLRRAATGPGPLPRRRAAGPVRPPRHRHQHPAAGRGGLRPEAPPALGPAAQPVRGPAAGVGRRRHPPADRGRARGAAHDPADRPDHPGARPDAARRLGPGRLPEELHEATKLTIYVGRQERVYRVPAFVAVCDLLHRRGVAGATVLLGVDGTAHGQRQRARFFARNADVPMMIIAVGSGRADRPGAARARRPAAPPAGHPGAGPRLQARRRAARAAARPARHRRPRHWRCGRS